MKTNRRTFLKQVGLAVTIPCLPLVSAEETELFSAKMCAKIRKQLKPQPIKPVMVDGKGYYLCTMHPKQEYDLRVMAARDKYKHDHWAKRYNKWRSSQGRPGHQSGEGIKGFI